MVQFYFNTYPWDAWKLAWAGHKKTAQATWKLAAYNYT